MLDLILRAILVLFLLANLNVPGSINFIGDRGNATIDHHNSCSLSSFELIISFNQWLLSLKEDLTIIKFIDIVYNIRIP